MLQNREENLKARKKKKHEREVRLTNNDLKNGKLSAANGRMRKEEGGGGGGGVECLNKVNWENTKVVSKECGFRLRNVKEGIESLIEMHC